MNKILEKLGLPAPLSKIYLSLLDLGHATLGTLSKQSGIYRPTLYRNLPLLIEKGLVSKSQKGKRTVYIAEDPSRLILAVDDLNKEFQVLLPELQSRHKRHSKKPLIRFFEGKKGIELVYEDLVTTMKKSGTIYRYESPKDYKKNSNYYPQIYWKHAAGSISDIEKYVITNEKTHNKRSPRLGRLSVPIPASYDEFDYDVTEIIYKDKVAFVDYESETASIIENERFAEFQKKLFMLMFKKLGRKREE